MTRYLVALLLVLALGVRVAEVQSTTYRPRYDAGAYLKLASEIAQTGTYSSHDRGAGGTQGPSAYWPPGYPYVLAAIDLIDGHSSPRGAAVNPTRLSQALLGTVTVALIGLVGFELFGPTVALIAVAIAAVYPVLVVLSGLIVAENLMVALVLGAVWAVLRSRRATRPWTWIAAAGMLTGLATLTHQNAILILIPLVVAVWRRPRRLTASSVRMPALLIGVSLLTVLPWTIRNAVELHRFVPVSDEAGITLRGTYNDASASFRPVPYKWRFYAAVAADRPLAKQAPHLTESQLDGRLLSRALGYIGDHPLSPLDVAFHNSLRLLELEGSFAWHASARVQDIPVGTALVGIISFWLVGLLAAAGAFTRVARAAPRWIWAIPLLLALSVVLVNVETPRFREPVEPFLVLLAACALAALGTRLIRRAPVGRRLEPAVPRREGELVDVGQRLP